MDEVAAKRYAKAIFEVAMEENSVEKFQNELDGFKELFESGELDFLSNPVFSQTEKLSVIEEICERKKYSSDVKSFLRLLVHEKRIESVPAIYANFKDLLMEHLGLEVAVVYSAVEISKAQALKLGNALSKARGKKIELKNIVDESVIGGIKIRIGGFLYDGSIKTALDRFKTI